MEVPAERRPLAGKCAEIRLDVEVVAAKIATGLKGQRLMVHATE